MRSVFSLKMLPVLLPVSAMSKRGTMFMLAGQVDRVLDARRRLELRRLRQLVAADVDRDAVVGNVDPAEQRRRPSPRWRRARCRCRTRRSCRRCEAAAGRECRRPVEPDAAVDRGDIGLRAGRIAGDVRHDGAVGCVGDVLDDDRVAAAARRIARIGEEGVAVDLGLQVAEADVDREGADRLDDAVGLEPVDVGVDIVVDRGPLDDAADLQALVLVVERREVEAQRGRRGRCSSSRPRRSRSTRA